MEADELITARYVALESVLDERQRRLYAAVEAKVLGHGGVKWVHEATGAAQYYEGNDFYRPINKSGRSRTLVHS